MRIFNRLQLRAGGQARRASHGKPGRALDERMAAVQRRRRQLRQAGREWDPALRRLLARFGRARWPEPPRAGALPLLVTRIRRRDEPGRITWWVEHDLPPYDRYRCAAYFVDLEVAEDGAPVLTVRGDRIVVRLEHPAEPDLDEALASALQTPPAIIPRQMGAAFD